MASVSPAIGARAIPTFTYSEIEAMVQTAHALGVKVAGTRQNCRSGINLLNAGADSIEHGSQIYKDASLMGAFCNSQSTMWIPTLAIYHEMQNVSPQGWEDVQTSFRRALEMGMGNVACGGDTGPFPHGDNALEMKANGQTWCAMENGTEVGHIRWLEVYQTDELGGGSERSNGRQ